MTVTVHQLWKGLHVSALFLVFISIAAAVQGPIALHRNVDNAHTSTTLLNNDSASLVTSAINSLQNGEGPLGSTPASCSVLGTGNAACTAAQASQPMVASGTGWNLSRFSPSGRFSSSMTYDAADGYAVLFGGFPVLVSPFGRTALGDTWNFSKGVWKNITSQGPSARGGSVMTFDGKDGYVVLYGGFTENANPTWLTDTWKFQAGVWTNITATSGNPSPHSSITYDASDGYVVLFGSPFSGAGSNDTWKFSNGVWSNITLSAGLSPSPRSAPSMVYDAADRYVVLFGGSTQISSFKPLGDTWRFAGGSWTNITASVIGGPSARGSASIEYDTADQEVVLFGGLVPFASCCTTSMADTWKFQAGAWTNITAGVSPIASESPSITFDPTGGYVVLFELGDFNLAQTWKFLASIWTNITPNPSARGGAAVAYDAADGYVVLFGGTDVGDTWKYQNGVWTNITANGSPAVQYGATMAYDAADGYIVLFGTEPYRDTWKFLAGTWTNITLTAGPPPPARSFSSMTFDVGDNYVVLFGGYSFTQTGITLLRDTWTFKAGVWANITQAGGPPARYGQSMAYDGADNYVVLFGGSSLHDTWKFSANAWTNITSSVSPGIRTSAAMTYDAGDGYVCLYGGSNTTTVSSTILGDTWMFLGSRWTNITMGVGPDARFGASIAYDTKDHYVLLFGGNSINGPADDTWTFSLALSAPFDFSLTGPGSITVAQGTSSALAANQIVATLIIGSAVPVTFSISSTLPNGITATIGTISPPLGNNQCTPTCTVGIGFTASLTAPLGIYTVAVQAAGGGVTKTVSFSLTVEVPFTFSLSTPSPDDLTVTQGLTSESSSITATVETGTPGPLGFLVTSTTLPVGITPTFTNDPCTPDPSCTVTVSFSAAISAPIGTYSLTILASGRSAPQRVRLTLTLIPPPFVSRISCGHDLSCTIVSNATLYNLRFAGNTLHVEADGPQGAYGYANASVPKTNVPQLDRLHVFVDNNKLAGPQVRITSNSTAYFIYFTFAFHSPVQIDIQLTAPEQTPTTPTILGLDPTLFYTIFATLVAIIVIGSAGVVFRRRGKAKPKNLSRESLPKRGPG